MRFGVAVAVGLGGAGDQEIEAAAALEEGLLVAEVADVGASAGDDDRVGHEVQLTPDQIPPE